MRAERDVVVGRGWRAELGRGLGSRRNGPDADILVVEELEPLRQRPSPERRLELARELVLRAGELPLGQVGSADQLAGRAKNFGSSAPSVRCRPSAVGYTR